MTLEKLISPAYLQEQKRLHAEPRGYGQRGGKWCQQVSAFAWEFGYQTVLDYGCGQGSLAYQLRLASRFKAENIFEYDPAIPGKDTLPEPADLVVATDVLEHVEPDRIWFVLQHLASLTKCACFVVISLVETAKTLSDGQQAHILLRSVEWWKAQFAENGLLVSRELSVKPEKQWCALLVKEGR